MRDHHEPSRDREVESIDLSNPYPRQVAASQKPAWSERWPWEWTPYASIALNFTLSMIRSGLYGPLGLSTVKMLIFTMAAIAGLLLWMFGCYVTFRSLVSAAERIHLRKPWLGALFNALMSFLASLVSATLALFIVAGND